VDIKILRLLIIDDSPDDADVTVATLRKAGYMLKTQRVQDMAGLQTALSQGQWDLILCEYNIPHFGAQFAIDLVKGSHLDTPFFVLAKKISDAALVQIMRNGARDVILKAQSARLAPAIQRELRAHRDRETFRKQQYILKETEDKHRAIIEGSREAVCYAHEGMHIDTNVAYLELFGYENTEELEGIPVLNLIKKDDHKRFKEFMRKKVKNSAVDLNSEFEAIKKDGAPIFVDINISDIDHKGEHCTQIIFTDITKRKAVEKKLQYLNQRDPLTGLYNRHFFLQKLGAAVEKAKAGSNQSTLLFLDLSQLKKINENAGHAAGDRLLLVLAKLFREKLGDQAVISRFSGDEFAVLLPDQGEKQATQTAKGLEATLKDTTFTEGDLTFKCSCMLGKVLIDEKAENARQVLSQAYRSCAVDKPAKALDAKMATVPTVNNAQVRTETKQAAEASIDPEWQRKIQQALQSDSLELAFQPIINLHGDPADYFEVLVRMSDGEGGQIPAGDFIATANATGQILDIDKWVISHAIPALAELHQEGHAATFFINISRQSMADSSVPKLIHQAIKKASINGYHLIFEADEPDLICDPIAAGNFIRTIHDYGCQFCMDNFGQGFGDHNFLRHQAIEYVKITGSLIHNLTNDTINQAILKGLTIVANALGKKIIAKFVEDAESLSLLWDLEISYVQGNYFQQADAEMSFEDESDASEATLSSDESVPNWANN
jgi:diguanylate cyclase (GGDEF)-like protein/PAS domain S-box-containing protein